MSTWVDRQLCCPRCGHVFAARVAAGLHITRLPEVRRDILAGRFHRGACPSCGTDVEVDASLLYTDFARHHWVRVEPIDRLSDWRSLELESEAAFRVLFAGGAAVLRGRAPELHKRLVFGVAELREKLLLWDAGLDDAIVEVAKLAMVAGDLGGVVPGSRFFATAISDGGEIVGDQIDDGGAVRSRWRLPAAALARASAGAGERFPELFSGTFVSITRLIGRFA